MPLQYIIKSRVETEHDRIENCCLANIPSAGRNKIPRPDLGNAMKIKTFFTAIILCVVSLLSGCLFPEEFEASVTVDNDGSYTFIYDGTVTYAMILDAANDGKLSQREEDDFAQILEGELRAAPYVEKARYLGKGRTYIFLKKAGKAGEDYYFSLSGNKYFHILHRLDGLIEISAAKIGERMRNELKSIGAKIDGTLTVSVDDGVRVVAHNAQSEPRFFGLFGDYEWKIESVDAVPYIIVQPSY